MRSRRLALATACLLASVGSAAAQERDGVAVADRAALAACLRESETVPRSCIGTIAVPCARQADGDRRDAGVDCGRREGAAWRERLDFAGRVLLGRLDGGARGRFAALQRSWEEYVVQKCAFAGATEPARRAPLVEAGCDLREVALRAIEVEALAERGRRADDAPPRIER